MEDKRNKLKNHLQEVIPGFDVQVSFDVNDNPIYIKMWSKDLIVTRLCCDENDPIKEK